MEAVTAGLVEAVTGNAGAELESGTRERILDAALERFETFGLKRTTMEDVAAAAGLGRVTLYRQFSGRDALVEAVILREARRFLAELDETLRPLSGLDELATEGFVRALQALRGHRLMTRLYATERELLLPFLTIGGAPIVSVGREYLARLLAETASAEPAGYDDVAEALVRLVQSFLLTPDSVVDLEDGDALRRFARDVVVPMVVSRERGRGES